MIQQDFSNFLIINQLLFGTGWWTNCCQNEVPIGREHLDISWCTQTRTLCWLNHITIINRVVFFWFWGNVCHSDKVKARYWRSPIASQECKHKAKVKQTFPSERLGDSARLSPQVLAMSGLNSSGFAVRRAVCIIPMILFQQRCAHLHVSFAAAAVVLFCWFCFCLIIDSFGEKKIRKDFQEMSEAWKWPRSLFLLELKTSCLVIASQDLKPVVIPICIYLFIMPCLASVRFCIHHSLWYTFL